VRGWALAHVGDFEAGTTELTAGIDASKPIMGRVALPQFIAMMAEALLLANDAAAAEAWLLQAIDFDSSHDDRYYAAEVHRLAAVCLAARGDTAGARAHLREALEVARAQGATLFELRAALVLAAHDAQEGREALRSVMGRFPEPEPWAEVTAARQILC
jgi:predicted ATPase